MIPLHLPWLDSEEETATLRVLRSGRLAGNGAECAALERDLQARIGGGMVLASGLSLPRTERVAASIIRLPIYPGLADEDVRHVVACLRGALGG